MIFNSIPSNPACAERWPLQAILDVLGKILDMLLSYLKILGTRKWVHRPAPPVIHRAHTCHRHIQASPSPLHLLCVLAATWPAIEKCAERLQVEPTWPYERS